MREADHLITVPNAKDSMALLVAPIYKHIGTLAEAKMAWSLEVKARMDATYSPLRKLRSSLLNLHGLPVERTWLVTESLVVTRLAMNGRTDGRPPEFSDKQLENIYLFVARCSTGMHTLAKLDRFYPDNQVQARAKALAWLQLVTF